MTQKDIIHRIAERLLKNAVRTSSSGLYDGKAGMAFSLIMAAAYLEDEHIDDKAYNLLKESLIIRNNDVGFENGLSGIGYVLLYLIENDYLEDDFNKLFELQYEVIIRSFENMDKRPLQLLNLMQTIYFFSKAGKIKREERRIQTIIKRIFDGIESFLTVQLRDFSENDHINRKATIMDIFSTYLKLVDYSDYSLFSRSLMEDYAALYRKDRIVSSLETGYYLSRVLKIGGCNEFEIFQDVVDENIRSGISNALISPLSLREKIDYARIIDVLKPGGARTDKILPDIKSMNVEHVMQGLLKIGDDKRSPYGYGSGLGRLLIHYANKEIELL